MLCILRKQLTWGGVVTISALKTNTVCRGFASILLLVVIFLFAGSAKSDDAEFAEGARLLVVKLADETLKSVVNVNVDRQTRQLRFKELLHEYFAFKGIAKWVLGRYWRKATEPERDEFNVLFERLMILTYAERFEKYGGESLSIGKAEVKGEKDALVHSSLVRPNGLKPINVIWRIRGKDNGYKIVDVMIEGLSLGLAQQKEYSSVIRKNGGTVAGLLKEMRQQIIKQEALVNPESG